MAGGEHTWLAVLAIGPRRRRDRPWGRTVGDLRMRQPSPRSIPRVLRASAILLATGLALARPLPSLAQNNPPPQADGAPPAATNPAPQIRPQTAPDAPQPSAGGHFRSAFAASRTAVNGNRSAADRSLPPLDVHTCGHRREGGHHRARFCVLRDLDRAARQGTGACPCPSARAERGAQAHARRNLAEATREIDAGWTRGGPVAELVQAALSEMKRSSEPLLRGRQGAGRNRAVPDRGACRTQNGARSGSCSPPSARPLLSLGCLAPSGAS